MTRLLSMLSLAAILFATSCSKDDDNSAPVTYMPTTANSSWTYDTTNLQTASTGSYTLTATNRDTTAINRTYRVFTSTGAGGNSYYAQSGTDYYQFSSVANLGTQSVSLLYFKDEALNTTWTENQSVTITGSPLPVTVPITYQVVKKGYDTTIGTNTFKDVSRIKISLGALTASGFPIGVPTTDINYVYARGVGRIYSRVKVVFINFNINVDIETRIKSYSIK